MRVRSRRSGACLAAVVATALLTACGSAPSPPASPSVQPSTSVPPVAFDLEVVPASFVGRAIGGQRVVLLVTVSGSAPDGPVQLSATAGKAAVSIEPQPAPPGIVAEVTVVPEPVAEGSEPVDLEVAITGSRAGVERTVRRTVSVAAGTDGLGTEAAVRLAPFLAWLETNRPELGIDTRTSWQPTPGTWVLVVNHYAFVSADWELELSWHVMIPPDDWARIALRRRWIEARPSVAFEIASFSGGTAPREIDPPEGVWR